MKINYLLRTLKTHYPKADIALNYDNNIQLLVAVILSAQCTDVQVNKVTSKLFKRYITVKDFAYVDLDTFKQEIRSTGFYNNKARNIINSAKLIIDKHHSKVPDTMQELLKLSGVARKTANIILNIAYDKREGIAVDTHVKRLSYRLGLTKESNPKKIEKDLINLIPKEEWGNISYLLIEHGRAVCGARKPKCDICFLNKVCPKNRFR